MYKNIFYFKSINKIGGTEQYLYEIAKKYHKYDITIFYDKIDTYQLKRLSKYVRCKQRVKGQKIKCEKAFYNYNIEMIEDVEAKEHIFICHAIYQVLGITPPIHHPKLTRFIGVSDYSSRMLKEYANKKGIDIEVETCYNPLTLEPKEKVKILVSACRLDDRVKGGGRTLELIKALDKYCKKNNRHYIWFIFTNKISKSITSKNVILMEPRVDIRPYIASADYVVQLSDDMETYCYTTNEALSYGVPIVTTPLSINKELNIKDNIILDWNCYNINDVVEKIFNKEFKVNYKAPNDNYEDILDKTENKYIPIKYVKIKAIRSYYDKEVKRNKTPKSDAWEVAEERANHLIKLGLAKIVNEE